MSTEREAELIEQINQAEKLRELGATKAALEILDHVVWKIKHVLDYSDNMNILAQALAHRIICHKHIWQNTGDEFSLREMLVDVINGELLPVSTEDKAVFYLRHGDCLSSMNMHNSALEQYRLAYESVKKGGVEEVEYLGHLAEALVGANRVNASEALNYLDQAMDLMKKIESGPNEQKPRDWHSLIIWSGLYGRKAFVLRKSLHINFFSRSLQAFAWLWQAFVLAVRLKNKHGMPQRYNQFFQRLARKKS